MPVSKKQFNPSTIRRDFPILTTKVNNKPLTYFDNAATTHKPVQVLAAISDFYAGYNSNIHRGIHALSQEATAAYEGARYTVSRFINAQLPSEIVFTRGATESINLVATSFVQPNIKASDNIVISVLEHHANIVPWQIVCEKTGAELRVAPVDRNGRIKLAELKKLITNRTKLVSVIHASNSLGVINPIEQIIRAAHAKKVPVLIDASQSIQHEKIDVQKLNCDFLVFSGHKLYGPTGIGVLYGKQEVLAKMPPYQSGGDMISKVSFTETTFQDPPQRFEAGTPHIAGAIGLAAAMEYIESIGLKKIKRYEQKLLTYTTKKLQSIGGLKIIGGNENKAPIISFVIDGVHPHDIGTILDQEGIAIRTGHHCNQPIMDLYGLPATARVSLAFYNTTTEIDRLVRALLKVKKMFNV